MLGYPITDGLTTPDKIGLYNHFEHGSIYTSTQTDAHELHGLIREKWISLGSEQSVLGYPTTDELVTPDSIGRYNHFQRGSIYWSPDTETHFVTDAIRDKWAARGWEKSPLGYPITDEISTPDGVGRYNDFQGGSIYWSSTTGPHTIRGIIRDKWLLLNRHLGFPTSDSTIAPDGLGEYNEFQSGTYVWNPETGAYFMTRQIADKWNALGGVNSYLGYPTSDSTNDFVNGVGGNISRFQYGMVFVPQGLSALDIADSITLNSIWTTAGLESLGGKVEVILFSNGNYRWKWLVSNSSYIKGYRFSVRSIIKTKSQRIAIAAEKANGRIGTRTFNQKYHEEGNRRFIRNNWTDILEGATLDLSKEYKGGGLFGTIGDIFSFIAQFYVDYALLQYAPILTIIPELAEFAAIGPCALDGISVKDGYAFASNATALVPIGVAGLAIGAITESSIKCREMWQDEYDFANVVFRGKLPPRDKFVLTNLTKPGAENKFTWPLTNDRIIIGLGNAFDNPKDYPNVNIGQSDDAYPVPGEVFIHELTHAWQIYQSSLLELFLDAMGDEGPEAYKYGSPGQAWSKFNLEQKASIVNEWFAGRNHPLDSAKGTDFYNRQQQFEPMSQENPYFAYILNNIWAGNND